MAKECDITGKKPMVGNRISHSNIKTKRRSLPNLQKRRIFIIEENRWVTIRVTPRGLKTLNKKGAKALRKHA